MERSFEGYTEESLPPSDEDREGAPEVDQLNLAEETRQVLDAPRHERKEKLAHVQERLERYITTHAELQEQIVASIRSNPDLTLEDIKPLLDNAAVNGTLTDQDRLIVEDAVARYAEKHRAIQSIREEYPDDKSLYDAIFGAEPFGDVQVITGPMTFYFRCHDDRDYARIRSQKFSGDEIEPEDVKEANKSGGVHIWASPIPELTGTLIAENTHHNLDNRWSWFTLRHEEQHAINHLLAKEGERFRPGEIFDQDVFDACSREQQTLLLNRYLRWWRESVEMQAQDELLAYYKEGQYRLYEVYEILTKKVDEGGIYDYMDKHIKKALLHRPPAKGGTIVPLTTA
jgi:hypothetical protein